MRRIAAAAVGALALLAPAAAAAFVPNDPFASRQWYLEADHAFDAWPAPPVLPPVRVAVIDSGIDAGHPELQGRIVAARSFVGGSVADRQGHGTFIAGIIAASTNNAVGIAGLGLPVQLVIARIVTADGRIPIDAEAAAIRWAADQGARVINLSIGGLRAPRNRIRDTYSALEASAVRYAYSNGAVLVAAVGNADQAPRERWPYASYPAALPHVIGVSAYARDGSVPAFSNRDAVFNDLSAPGQGMFSIFPRALTSLRPGCTEQGYSSCAPAEYRDGEGTSFAAPQVSAAAALLLATRPDLRADQVATILERSADDANASNGCKACAARRDSVSGWGRLDIGRAVAAAAVPPAPDRYEPNDDAGLQAVTLSARARRLHATLDFWDDPRDVYRVRVAAGRRLRLRVTGPAGTNTDLALWKPGTRRLDGVRSHALRAAQSIGPGATEQLAYRAPHAGWYYIELRVVRGGSGPYTLTIGRRR